MKIRIVAESAEIDKIIPLALHDARTIGLDLEKLNMQKLRAAFQVCMNGAAIFVAEQKNEVVGVMALMLVESFWCDDYTLTNLIYWVNPEHRKSHAGRRLLKAAKEYAAARQLELTVRVESYTDLDRKERFFARSGFVPCGGNYKFKE